MQFRFMPTHHTLNCGWVGPCTKTVFSGGGGVIGRGPEGVIFDLLYLYSSLQVIYSCGVAITMEGDPLLGEKDASALHAGAGVARRYIRICVWFSVAFFFAFTAWHPLQVSNVLP